MDLFTVTLNGLVVVMIAAVVMGQRSRKRGPVELTLHDAAATGDMRRVKELLSLGVSPDTPDEDGTTALMAAAFAGQAALTRALLDAGADPDVQDASGMTALSNAVIAACEMDLGSAHPIFVEIVEVLLAAGADTGLEDEDGATAADHARSCALEDLVALLEGY